MAKRGSRNYDIIYKRAIVPIQINQSQSGFPKETTQLLHLSNSLRSGRKTSLFFFFSYWMLCWILKACDQTFNQGIMRWNNLEKTKCHIRVSGCWQNQDKNQYGHDKQTPWDVIIVSRWIYCTWANSSTIICFKESWRSCEAWKSVKFLLY